jgi:hypothetical protein
VRAQTPIPVTDEASWDAAIAAVNANPGANNVITISNNLFLTSQVFVNGNVTIDGGGNSMSMQIQDRAMFIAGGAVTVENLSITQGVAGGGEGYDGAGGGAGLGGAIFIGSGSYASGNGDPTVNGVSAPQVTLNNVNFMGNQARGGVAVDTGGSAGGGGGLGGTGGFQYQQSGLPIIGGGGGGIGVQANGGEISAAGQAGIFAISGQSNPGGDGGNGNLTNGTAGGTNAGGGGAGGVASSFSITPVSGSGGGGGVNGGRGYFQNSAYPNGGGAGGYGGGGGGSIYYGGAGGYGGGGGGGTVTGGAGGYGGGGGAGGTNGTGGFGGGNGSGGVGGGGLGAGGAVFVSQGATLTIQTTGNGGFVSNSAGGGSGGTSGSSYGNDIFVGGTTAFSIASGRVLGVNGLGGEGSTTDPNVVGRVSNLSSQGGVSLAGGGTLQVAGGSYYTGATILNKGTMEMTSGATEEGTTTVVVGQNSGDNATLSFDSGSNLTMGGGSTVITLGQNAGAAGAMLIGADGLNGADLGISQVTTGSGSGTLTFNESHNAPGTSTVYPFFPTISGSTRVIQKGTGTTLLSPGGSNTYTGGTLIEGGTLDVSTAAGLGSGTVQVNGGTLLVSSGVASNEVLLAGGSYDVAVSNGASLAGVANASSNFAGGTNTTASILAGTSAGDITLATSFQTISGALDDIRRISDIYSLDGTGNVPFVLQLSTAQVTGDSFLASLDSATNEWINTVLANTGNTASGSQLDYQGSFASFQATYGTNLDSYMGAYGVDTSTGSAWAVVDHTGSFSAVPEPAAATIAIPLSLGLLSAWRRSLRKALVER